MEARESDMHKITHKRCVNNFIAIAIATKDASLSLLYLATARSTSCLVKGALKRKSTRTNVHYAINHVETRALYVSSRSIAL